MSEEYREKSYIFTAPQVFDSLDDALTFTAARPRAVFQSERFYDRYRTWLVVFVGPHCPICGLSDGVSDPGAPDPRRQGGAEHICWKCAKAYKPFIQLAQRQARREINGHSIWPR